MPSHDDTVQRQFDPRAQAYLHSAVHAQGPDLDWARACIAREIPADAAALDVGCGAGHLSFLLAGCVARVTAVDPSPGMLATVAQNAAARGLSGIQVRLAAAESLPFADASFRLVCSRYSAHHWRRLQTALQELRRVLEADGRLLLIDLEGDEDALVDTYLQTLELLRDPSHVRDRSVTQWQALLQAAGFMVVEHQRWPLRLQFKPWVERMRTAPVFVRSIRELQQQAPSEVQQALAFEADGSFTAQTSLFWARKAR